VTLTTSRHTEARHLAETEEHKHPVTKPKDSANDGKLIKTKLCLASKRSYLDKQKLKTKSLDKSQILMKNERKWSFTAFKRSDHHCGRSDYSKNERPETRNCGTKKSTAI
jgi:hypothetical protein